MVWVQRELTRNPWGTSSVHPALHTPFGLIVYHKDPHTLHHQSFPNKRLIINTYLILGKQPPTRHQSAMKSNKRERSKQAINYVPLFQTVSLSGPPQTSPDAALHAMEHPLDAGLWSFSISLPQKHSAPNSVPASVYPAASQALVQAPLDISEPIFAR